MLNAIQRVPFLERKTMAFFIFLIIYAILFSPRVIGAGQFWDNVFPIYPHQIENYFLFDAYSWNHSQDFGKPLGYSSNYYFRILVSLFGFLQPEHLFYAIYVCLFALGSLGLYVHANKYIGSIPSFVISLAGFINPAIFYKFTAGHIDYLVSYAILIHCISFLVFRFQNTVNNYFLLGLFIALIGIQIQFFVLAAIITIVYFIMHFEKTNIKGLFIIYALAFCINLPWLTNFFSGGASISEVSSTAAKQIVVRSASTDFLDIFLYKFSDATSISRIYSVQELFPYFIITVLIIYGLCSSRHVSRLGAFYAVSLLLFIFMGTGVFHSFDVHGVSWLYPMFRESGHLAPVIILFFIYTLLLLIARGKFNNLILNAVYILFFVNVCVSGIKYIIYSQSIDFSLLREKYEEFSSVATDKDVGSAVLTYPFFGQYALRDVPILTAADGFHLTNTGYDSFNKYAGIPILNNSIPPHGFKNSLQYLLLETGNLNFLGSLGIKYMFDYSNIYESYYEKYVPAEAYGNTLPWVKNDPNFFEKILEQNHSLKKISDQVYEIEDSAPIIHGFTTLYSLPASTTNIAAAAIGKSLVNNEHFYFTKSDVPNLSTVNVLSIFTNFVPTAQHTLSSEYSKLLVNHDNLIYRVVKSGEKVTIQGIHDGRILVNNTSEIGNSIILNRSYILSSLPTDTYSFDDYYLVTNNKKIPLSKLNTAYLSADEFVSTSFSTLGDNVIINPSFETGLWQDSVSDCNNYDNNAEISMNIDSTKFTHGNNSLELRALRHTACTRTDVSVKPGSSYFFNFDFKSNQTNVIRYALEFYETKELKSYRAKTMAGDWQTYSNIVHVPPNVSRVVIYIYAEEQNGTVYVENNFDNFEMREIISSYPINDHKRTEEYLVSPMDIKKGKYQFEFIDYVQDQENLIGNGSFEDGLWRETVNDCNNFDSKPQIGMKHATSSASDGAYSLELSASHHTACTNILLLISGGSYLLSFNHQSPEASPARYYFEASGENRLIVSEVIPVTNSDWFNYSKYIEIPRNVNSASLYLYAKPEYGNSVVIRYDDVRLVRLPNVVNKYYLVEKDKTTLDNSFKSITFDLVNPTKKLVHIKGATTPFYLAMSESYHPQWQAQLTNEKNTGFFDSWVPWARPDAIANDHHFELNGFLNGWYVDTAALCTSTSTIEGGPANPGTRYEELGTKNSELLPGCYRNPDGSYDIELTLEFTPQRWFYLGLLISGATLVGCVGYLVYDLIRRRRTHKLPRSRDLHSPNSRHSELGTRN